MAIRKMKHELISNESKRKVSFKKRKGGLLKKMNELTTLYGIMGCAIIYSTFDNRPEIWPSLPMLTSLSFVRWCGVLDRFIESPEEERERYTMDQKTFLGRHISWSSNALERERKKNRGLEIELTLNECLAGKSMQDLMCLEDIKELQILLEENIKCFTDKIETWV
ncbi:hypothetical protein EZV62_015926 [Acer yangbiense]|uniref:MADS-box domain-containing protein n=1 Tax=Acer yangbiense TaxID=1000413 RepID=A0A5C7HM49_9ROSI|nr:hypothetical protein EZV62_015926 [Acer yangbiense]